MILSSRIESPDHPILQNLKDIHTNIDLLNNPNTSQSTNLNTSLSTKLNTSHFTYPHMSQWAMRNPKNSLLLLDNTEANVDPQETMRLTTIFMEEQGTQNNWSTIPACLIETTRVTKIWATIKVTQLEAMEEKLASIRPCEMVRVDGSNAF